MIKEDVKYEIAKEWLDFLREQYPAGSRIQLREIGSDPAPIHLAPWGPWITLTMRDSSRFPGTKAVVWRWSLERTVSRSCPGTSPVEALYMPLTADFYPRDEWGDSSKGERWDDRTLTEYEDKILGALVKKPDAGGTGTWPHALWYGEQDSLNAKVRSAEFTVEVRDGCLWGVAECQVVVNSLLES